MTERRTGLLEAPPERQTANLTALGHAAVFAIGATSGLQVMNFTATALSVVCLLLVPAFFLKKHRGVELLPLVLAALGWISFLASCLITGTSVLWPNALAPAAFSLYFLGLAVLTGGTVDAVATLLGGVGAGTVIFFLTKGIELTHTGNFLDLWKYGIAHGVTLLMLFGLTMLRASLLWQSIALVFLGLASLGLNFRSHALVCLLAAVTMLSHRFLGSRIPRVWQFAGIIVSGLLFSYGMPIAGRAGLFGRALQAKTIEQDGTHLPVLLAGRTEPPMTITAIMERPFLGWGSALNMDPEMYTRAEHLAVRMGYAPTFPFEIYWRLPAHDYSAMHSILWGTWAEGGIVAAALPMFLLVACVGMVWNHARFGIWTPLALVVALQGIWDLLYAPWTYNMIIEYVCIALLFSATHFKPRQAQ